MSKICRTFATNLKKTMSKMTYIQPQMVVEIVSTDAFVMLLDSGSGPQPTTGGGSSAPARNGEVID